MGSAPKHLACYTEDSADDGPNVQEALVRALLGQVEPAARGGSGPTGAPVVRGERSPAARGMHGTNWRAVRAGTREHEARKRLVAAIATHIGASELVVVHFDADRTWSRRDSRASAAAWGTYGDAFVRLRTDVAAALRRSADATAQGRADEVDQWLLAMVPFYCVESWLYLAALPPDADLPAACKAAADSLRAAVSDKTGFDHIGKPADQPPGKALGKVHNLALAEAFTAAVADEASARSPSFRATILAWTESPPLRAALGATYAPGPPPSASAPG